MKTRNINIKLGTKDLTSVDNILNQVKNLPSLSANELLHQLEIDKFNSKVVDAIFNLLTDEEEPRNKTYLDQNNKGDMSIGVGLDIQPHSHDDAKAVLLSVNPKWDFEGMQANENLPDVGLTPEEIKQVFYYTLKGATYEGIHFQGEIPALIRHLDNMSKKLGYETKLSDIPLKPHELVCLVSMAFNNPSLIGENFCKALHEYHETKDPTQLILQIMECSNKLYDDKKAIADSSGLQNRRTKELAIFLGDPENVHLSYRQFKRLERAYKTLGIELKPINGSPIYAQPYKEKERSSSTEETLKRIETMNDEYNASFVTYYGSKNGSEITVVEDDVHAVVICGDGNNIVNVKPNNYIESYPYLAGGIGHNQFNISSKAGNIMVWYAW